MTQSTLLRSHVVARSRWATPSTRSSLRPEGIGHQHDSNFVHRLFRGLSDELLDHASRPPVVVVPYSKARAKAAISGSR
jgi:hypothetical protein